VAAAAAADREPRRPRLGVVGGCREREAEEIAERDSAAGGDAAGGGPSRRPAVGEAGRKHFPTATGSGERAATRAPSRRVSTAPGDIEAAPAVEAAPAGTHHHVSAEHAQHDLASFACRPDRRRQPDSIAERLARAATRTAPRPYRTVTADA
jgi:hypothetical protein